MERNYDDLGGPKEGGTAGNYVDIDMNTCRLKIYGKDGQFGSIDGYFDGIESEEKEANKEARIPARTEYHVLFSTVLEKGTAPTQVKLRLSDHWKSPGWASILNALAGASMDPAWDARIRAASSLGTTGLVT